MIGELKQLEVQQKGLDHDLEIDYLDADLKFENAQKKLNTETFSNQDLEKYAKALDAYF